MVGYGFFSFFAGAGAANYPWVKEAKMVPMLDSAYSSLRAALPENLDTVLDDLRGAAGLPAGEAAPQDQPAQPAPAEQPAQPAPAPAPAEQAPANQSGN